MNKPGKNRARDIGFYALILIILLAAIFSMNQGVASTGKTYSEIVDLFLVEKVH